MVSPISASPLGNGTLCIWVAAKRQVREHSKTHSKWTNTRGPTGWCHCNLTNEFRDLVVSLPRTRHTYSLVAVNKCSSLCCECIPHCFFFATKQLLHKWVTAWQELAKRIYGPKQNPHKRWPVAPYNLSSIGPIHPINCTCPLNRKVTSCRQRTDHIHHARAHVEGSCVEKNEATCPPTTSGCSMLYVTIILEWKVAKILCNRLIWSSISQNAHMWRYDVDEEHILANLSSYYIIVCKLLQLYQYYHL